MKSKLFSLRNIIAIIVFVIIGAITFVYFSSIHTVIKSTPDQVIDDIELRDYNHEFEKRWNQGEVQKGKLAKFRKNPNAIRDTQEELKKIIDSLRFATPEKFMQTFINAYFEFVPYLCPANSYFAEKRSIDSATLDSLYSTDVFVKYISEISEIASMIDPESQYHTGHYLDELTLFDYFLSVSPSLRIKVNLEENYFSSIILQLADKTTDEEMQSTMKYNVADRWARSHTLKHKDIGIKMLHEILENYPNSRVVQSGIIDRKLQGLRLKPQNVNIGINAPMFSVKSITGDSINLNDFKNEFIYLDFWGT
jgi:hypothetical protein